MFNLFEFMDFTIILITFGIIFLGELGDKTQLIVFNLALEYKKFYKVGIGVTVGFAAIVTIGVLFGTIITTIIPVSIISFVSGIVFIIIGIIEALSLKKLYIEHKNRHDRQDENLTDEDSELSEDIGEKEKSKIQRILKKFKNNPYLAGFIFIFIMELGDKTQILTITLASLYNAPLEVWIGSFLALISVAWIGILIGAIVARKVPKFYLKLISSSVFIIVGVIILFTSF